MRLNLLNELVALGLLPLRDGNVGLLLIQIERSRTILCHCRLSLRTMLLRSSRNLLKVALSGWHRLLLDETPFESHFGVRVTRC